MARLLYDTETATLQPYPRPDDEPVINLDSRYLMMDLIQEAQPNYDPATQRPEPTEVIDLKSLTVTRAWQLVDLPPPGPAPDWIGFDIAIQSEPEIVATINDLGRLSQVATLSLGHALEEAEKGNLDRFLPIWQEWIIAASPPAAALERFRALAAQHHLPAEFQAAIAAPPAGPAVAP